MTIQNLVQAEEVLSSYVPNVTAYTGDDLSLERMTPLLKALGDPHTKLKVIHVAGTSGKTSTSYYASRILSASGQRTGLTVSPHVDSVAERIQINNVALAEAKFCSYLAQFMSLSGAQQLQPSYFEIMIALALWVFVQEKVDYAVVETGMGGLFDSTNVVTRSDKVCVITDIGYDHMHALGNTLPEIAAQKAGIMHHGNQAFLYKQSPEIMTAIYNRAESVGALVHELDEAGLSKNLQTDITTLSLFGRRNFLIARETCRYIATRDGFNVRENGTTKKVVPGRMDVFTYNDGVQVLMDGAHNGQKMAALVESVQAMYPMQKATVLLALKKGKEYADVLDALLPIASNIILTTFSTSQDLPAVSQDISVLATYCAKIGLKYEAVTDQSQALKMLKESTNALKIITGSFYLLSQLRKPD